MKPRMAIDVWDIGALGALSAMGVGLWWLHPSLTLIVLGAIVLTGCAWGSRRPAAAKEGP